MENILSQNSLAVNTWKVDPQRSSIAFSVTQLFGYVTGSFKIYTGYIKTSKPDFSDATIDFWVNANSLDSGNKKRDKHLMSAHFFDAERFPHMEFKSVSITKTGILDYLLEGDLTIRNLSTKIRSSGFN